MKIQLPDGALLDSLVGGYRAEGEGGSVGFSLVRKGTFLHASGGRVGLALPWGKRLVVVFGPKDQVEIGAYKLEGKSITGLWVPPGADQGDFSACGVELSEVDATDASIWRITRAKAIDGSEYAGKVEREPIHGTAATGWPRAVQMLWRLKDGEFRSFGLEYEKAVYSTFCLEPESEFGLGVYDLKTLEGTVLTSTSRGPASERLVRS